MKSIKFIAQGSSSLIGGFGPGDIARNIPDDLADHLVKDARCAEYLDAPAAPPAAAERATSQPTRRRKTSTDKD